MKPHPAKNPPTGKRLNRSNFFAFRRLLAGLIPIIFLKLAIIASSAEEFFVAPAGSSTGNGSREQPWDLQTALAHPSTVSAGDTIWLRGGVYRKNNRPTLFISRLAGSAESPIIVRNSPGERAIIDGNISQSRGGSVDYWGFEIMNSHTNRLTSESGSFPDAFKLVQGDQTNDFSVSGFDLRATNINLINLVIHDSIGGGIGANEQAHNASFYGVLSYYNGWQGCDRSHGHGLYSQNVDPSFVFVRDSLFFANYALGIQATSTEGRVDNFFMEGTVSFFNGVLARKRQNNFLLGPFSGQATNAILLQNFIYDTQGTGTDVNIGYEGGIFHAQLYNNYFQTTVYFSPSNQASSIVGNQFIGGTRSLDPETFPDNSYSTNRPTTNVIEVRGNAYETGRGHIIVYNWENANSVAVDPGSFLIPGTEFEVRNAQDFFGASVLSGVYTGDLLHLPMTGLRVTKPVGTNAPASTAREFAVFVVLPREYPGADSVPNTAPFLSSITNLLTEENSSTEAIPFTISDQEIPADFLTISVHSSRLDLIPNRNIHFGGSGTNRTLTIKPVPHKAGASTITLAVSDGFLTVSNVFVVEVAPLGAPEDSRRKAPESFAFLRIQNTVPPLLEISAPMETEHEIEVSADLLNWDSLGMISTDCSGTGHVSDPNFSNYPARFYRILTDH